MNLTPDLERIARGLEVAGGILNEFAQKGFNVQEKEPGDPVTEADTASDRALRSLLPQRGDGWLSEETPDTEERLSARRVWVVDPLDGTREFVRGRPEWSVSIGLVVEGSAVAGGICNPATGETILGAVGSGVWYNGRPGKTSKAQSLHGAEILASRSEVGRGSWDRFRSSGIQIRPLGSVAYKMALVACGKADGMWTLKDKSEWDVAAGTALILAGGGTVFLLDGSQPVFNRRVPLIHGLAGCAPGLAPAAKALLGI